MGLILMIMSVSAAAYAQDIDVSSMTNEELTALLQQILTKLQQQEDPEAVTPAETPGPRAAEETPEFSIWENKKLIIEGLPEYMFIQKSSGNSEDTEDTEDTEDSGEPGGPSGPDKTPEPDTHNCPEGCVWWCPPVQPSLLPCSCHCQ